MRNLTFQPQADFLLIEPIPQDETPGGIALPDGASMNPPKGRVVRTGPGRHTEYGYFVEPTIKTGDIVYLAFAYNEPVNIELDGVEHFVVRERDVIAVTD